MCTINYVADGRGCWLETSVIIGNICGYIPDICLLHRLGLYCYNLLYIQARWQEVWA